MEFFLCYFHIQNLFLYLRQNICINLFMLEYTHHIFNCKSLALNDFSINSFRSIFISLILKADCNKCVKNKILRTVNNIK